MSFDHRPYGARAGVLGQALLIAAVVAALAACSSNKSKPDEEGKLVGSPGELTAHSEGEASRRKAKRHGALWYRIVVDGAELAFKIRLLRPADTTSFFLPGSGSDDEVSHAAITIGGASGPEGAVPVEQFPEEGRLDVETKGLPWVELDYRVDLKAFPDRPGRPTPRFTRDTALVYGPDVFVVPSKQVAARMEDIPVELHAPKSWEVLATWNAKKQQPSSNDERRVVHGFVTSELRTLRDAFFVAGPDIEVERGLGRGSSLTIALAPGLDAKKADIRDISQKVLDRYRADYGSTGRVLAYFRRAEEDDPSGVRGTAKRRGFVVASDVDEPVDSDTALLVAHEAFHLWNGHELIPEPEREKETRWFKEGVTHYVAIKTLHQTGLLGFDAVRRELARSAFNYMRNPASRGQRATRLDLHRLPYDRGLLLALALDAALMDCSGGNTTVGDWLTTLLEREDLFYTVETLHETFERTVGANCAAGDRLWRRHVVQDLPLNPEEIFADVGLHFLEASTFERTKVLPLEGGGRSFETMFSNAATHSTQPTSTDE